MASGAIDFASSFVTFFSERGEGNIARLQVDAACTVFAPDGTPDTYYLIAPCRSEDMYREDRLFKMPNYEFGGIFGTRDFRILRTAWRSEDDQPEYGENLVRFLDVRLDVRTFPGVIALITAAEIRDATLENVPLVARTEIADERTRRRAVLEYPVKTMNVTRDPARFQVDTGPVIVPDFASAAEHVVEQFDVAHVVYNRFDRAEFILRRPTPLAADGDARLATTDYSAITVAAARNTILRAA
jgi:hypothetical protein